MPDRDTLLVMLRNSAAVFTASFRDLPSSRFHFPPANGKWTIAQTAEHVVLAEVGSGKLLRGRLSREPAPPDVLAATEGADARIDARLRVRDRVHPAPDFVMPTGRWQDPGEMAQAFAEGRQATIDFLQSTPLDLTRHAAPHPALGPLTGLQWAYFLVRHCLRHVDQIEEVKASPGYPAH